MTQSRRKLIGGLLLTASVLGWAILATAVYLLLLMEMPWWVHIVYFAIAGFGWLWPATVLVRWMARPDA
ncbi:DUF2842 domain-containing protein [Devosia pacifica]|nr:DUF2842 domain-containing protein [Devosia pacifica]